MRMRSLGRSGWRLGSQITAMSAGGLFITVIVTAIFSSILISSALSNDYLRSGKNIATVLAEQVRVYVLIGNPEGARRSTEVVSLFPGMEQAAVYEFDGSLLAHFGDDLGWPAFETRDYLSLAETRLVEDAVDHWEFVAPVFADSAEPELEDQEAKAEKNSLIGWVRVRIGKHQLRQARNKIIIGNIAVISFFSLTLVMALRKFGVFLTRPLEDFVETMRASAEGQDHSLRVDLHGSRETQQLGSSFNHMMQVLEQRDDELAAARDQALDAARLKSEFAANVSHEIRTPLNGIVGTLDLLRRSGLDQQQMEYVELAESASTALVELINDILDFSRLTLDQSSVSKTAFDMHALLEELVVLQSRSRDAASIDILFDYDPRLPVLLESDPNKLRQLINNFLNNAIKFTERGSVRLVATQEAVEEDQIWVRLAVVDTGIGIDEHEQKRIFLPYAQSDGSNTRKYSGTGLGLAISEKIADVLQGDIGVLSEPGLGSEFFACIPCGLPAGREVLRSPRPQSQLDRLLVCADSALLVRHLENVASLAGLPTRLLHGQDLLEFIPAIDAGEAVTESPALRELLDLRNLRDEAQPVVAYAQSRAQPQPGLGRALETLAGSGLIKLVVVAGGDPGSRQEQQPGAAGPGVVTIDAPLRQRAFVAALDQLQQIERRRESRLHPGETARVPGCRVLLVDDNEINQKVAAGLLRELGCEVALAGDGIEAQEQVLARDFDVVFMDCRMPRMNGFEVTRWIRALSSNAATLPVIAMTANFEPQDQMNCFEAGMNDFLAKPVTLEQISTVLRKWAPDAACG